MREEHEHYTRDRPRPPARMSLPEFPQIDLRRRRRRPRVSVPQAEDVRPVPPARARGPWGGRAVCQVASRTRPDVWYTVYVAEGGTLFCTCPDFVHRRRHRGEECKHLLRAALRERVHSRTCFRRAGCPCASTGAAAGPPSARSMTTIATRGLGCPRSSSSFSLRYEIAPPLDVRARTAVGAPPLGPLSMRVVA